jgi:hypothetical protein
MLPSQQYAVAKLTKLQRDFLIDHVDGFKPFHNERSENATRESLIARKLIRWEPEPIGSLGMPKGTVITDPLGREARAMILGWYADALIGAIAARVMDEDKERMLLRVLMDSARCWRYAEPRDNINGRALSR